MKIVLKSGHRKGSTFGNLLIGLLVVLVVLLLAVAIHYFGGKAAANHETTLPASTQEGQPAVAADLIQAIYDAVNARNDVELSRLLHGADIHNPDMEDVIAKVTLSAAARGDIGTLRVIQKNGFSMEPSDPMGKKPIHLAVLNAANPAVYVCLVKEGHADVNASMPYTNETPLLLAVEQGDKGALLALINLKADFSAVNDKGQTALHIAAEKGDISSVKILLPLLPHIDINARDNLGRTPLYLAVANGQLDVVQFLNAHDADLSIADNKGINPQKVAHQLPDSETKNDILQDLSPLIPHAVQ